MGSVAPLLLATHFGGLAAVAASVVALVWGGRTLRGRPGQRILERSIAIVILVLWVVYVLWDVIHNRFNIRVSLPLHLCDWAALVAGLLFWTPRRTLHTLAYFWGLALSTQALVTPDIGANAGTLEWWAFWIYHAFVIGAGVYAVAVRQFRPTWHDWRVAVGLGALYVAFVFGLNVAFDLNYGYLGRARPSIASLLDYLGPWPWRVLVMTVLGALAMAALQFPWTIRRSMHGAS